MTKNISALDSVLENIMRNAPYITRAHALPSLLAPIIEVSPLSLMTIILVLTRKIANRFSALFYRINEVRDRKSSGTLA